MSVIAKHRCLGTVCVTLTCLALQATNTDKTSMFVEYEGEVLEVTKSFVTFPETSGNHLEGRGRIA